jgi:hypothetical protein
VSSLNLIQRHFDFENQQPPSLWEASVLQITRGVTTEYFLSQEAFERDNPADFGATVTLWLGAFNPFCSHDTTGDQTLHGRCHAAILR